MAFGRNLICFSDNFRHFINPLSWISNHNFVRASVNSNKIGNSTPIVSMNRIKWKRRKQYLPNIASSFLWSYHPDRRCPHVLTHSCFLLSNSSTQVFRFSWKKFPKCHRAIPKLCKFGTWVHFSSKLCSAAITTVETLRTVLGKPRAQTHGIQRLGAFMVRLTAAHHNANLSTVGVFSIIRDYFRLLLLDN